MATNREEVELITRFMTEGAREVAEDIEDIGDALEDAGDGAQSSGTRFTELASKLSLAKEAFAGVQQVAQLTVDTIKRGAEVQATANTFDNLTKSIGTTADVMLNELQAATHNTVSNFDLMQSANRFMAMGLAESADEAAKLAEVAVALGGAMGTGPNQAMEDFALLLANQSIPRLDTFGISSGKVRERVNELTSGINGLDRETAFLQATMEEAEKTMINVGDASDNLNTDIARLEAGTQNIKDAFSVAFSKQWAPIIGGLSDTMSAYEKAQADVNRAVEMGLISQEESITLVQNATVGYDYAQEKLREVRGELEKYDAEIEASNQATEDAQAIVEAYGRSQQELAMIYAEANQQVEFGTELAERYAEAGRATADATHQQASVLAFQAEQLARVHAAQSELVSIAQSAAGIIAEGYGAEALASEDSVARQVAAQEELRNELMNTALAQASAALVESGADPLEVARQQIQLQESLGTITSEQADAQRAHLENTQQTLEVTDALMQTFLQDGSLSVGESERLAEAVALIGTDAGITTDQIIALGETGSEHIAGLTDGFDLTNDSIAITSDTVQILKDRIDNLPTEKIVTIRVNQVGGVGDGSSTSHVMEEAGVN